MKKVGGKLLINWLRVRAPPESPSKGFEKSEDRSSIPAFFLPVNRNTCSLRSCQYPRFEPECSSRFPISKPNRQHFVQTVIGRPSRFDSRIPFRGRLRKRRREPSFLPSTLSSRRRGFSSARKGGCQGLAQNADHATGALFSDPPILRGGSENLPFSHNRKSLPQRVELW